ncbi:alpha/beta hydrolase [Kosmotoga pacifica]|uniref:Peptidase S15 n=1 Tax=Kosmotoga pacifica TaxID=1330330 RepID=A0A0G2Z840_9BACT|nr:alpha/beta hydrolase [Kosmotoga pacifica]AKI97780.1 peptidase S15 [Kosmotoga pacifica]
MRRHFSVSGLKRTLKVIVAFSLVIVGFAWNWAVVLFALVLLNTKTLYRAILGKLPLDVSDNSFTGPESHAYRREGSINLKLDIFYPKSGYRMPAGGYPVVFFAHGGGWISGFRRQANNISWCRYLASKGFAVVNIDYRFGYVSHIEAILKRYSDALNFVRNHAREFRLNPEKIALMGLSAGGHLALQYATYNSYHDNRDNMKGIKCVVAWYAPSDLMDLWDDDVESLFARFAVTTTLKGLPTRSKESYIRYSPITWVSERMVPTFLVHGSSDKVVPMKSSVKFFKKLLEHHVEAYLKVYNKADHAFEFELKTSKTIQFIKETVNFLHLYLERRGVV